MAEFAITLPVLLFVLWLVVDFARLYYTSNSLSTAVREGARFAAVQVSPTASNAAIKTKVKTAFQAFGGPAVTDAQIVVDSTVSGGAITSVTVTVNSYPWTKVTPIVLFTGGKVLITRKAQFRYEREGT